VQVVGFALLPAGGAGGGVSLCRHRTPSRSDAAFGWVRETSGTCDSVDDESGAALVRCGDETQARQSPRVQKRIDKLRRIFEGISCRSIPLTPALSRSAPISSVP
jgi:hypothetical protein